MSNLIEFLKTTEMMIVYVVALSATAVGFLIYLIDKNKTKKQQKMNTIQLNKMLEKEEIIEEKISIEKPQEEIKPIIIEENIEVITEKITKEEPIKPAVEVEQVKVIKTLEEIKVNQNQIHEEIKVEEAITFEELDYKPATLNKEEAINEIAKITQQLEKASENTIEKAIERYEDDQEKNAIISLEELFEKTAQINLKNETLMMEENEAPISLEEFEKTMNINLEKPTTSELTEAIANTTKEQPIIIETLETKTLETLEVDKSISDKLAKEEKELFNNKFKSTPIISPIFGIEKSQENINMQFENTANYQKLDQELKKTNEFLSTLKELQKKLGK